MAGARGKTRNLGDLEEGDRRLTPQRREGAVTQVVVQLPEVERPEVDIGQWYIGRRNAVLATRDTPMHCCRHSWPLRQFECGTGKRQ